YERIRSQLAALPGVSAVGIGSNMPLRTSGITLDIKADGHPVAPGQAQPHSEYRTASPDYFSAAGIPLLQGRAFTSTDRAGSARVVVLNKTLASQLFPNQDPIGQRVAWTGEVLKFIGVSGDWRTVVGVVGDTKDGGLDAAPIPATFIPFAQGDFPSGGFVIRTRSNPVSFAAAATRVVRQAAPDQPIEHVLTVEQIRDESVAPRRLNAMLVSSFGTLAMLVAAVGIAGVLAFSVSARTNEIGVRMSLGADSGRIQRMVLSEGGQLVLIGLTVGVTGAVSLTQLMRGLLFGVSPHDPVTLAIVALIMAVVGIGACWVPAVRAARIEPAVALRAN
ncbi:MAG TPA: FtsX-like permease family protein, partial [Gemmatimonadaceae bacterium]|nr:FtsX-like permease family protein [Gemmatimonadaceae bacterium]